MHHPSWFAVQRLFEGTYLIGEPMHVNSYLIVGSERAVLFDTGVGVENIRTTVETLTDKPVLAVNSHHHFDHVGGNEYFDDLAIHRLGAELVQRGPTRSQLLNYWAGFADYFAEYQVFRAMDAALFQVLAPEMQMRSLPKHFDVTAPRFTPSIPTRLLEDGEMLNLGDRQLEVLHTPGHSVDSICLFEKASQTLFTGDTIDTGPIYAQLAGASVEAFAQSVKRLAGLSGVDTLLSAHGARYRSYPELIGRVAQAFTSVVEGSVDFVKTVDCFAQDAKQAFFNDFSIVVPLDYGTDAHRRDSAMHNPASATPQR